MGVMALEGIVDHGTIRLTSNVHLPDNTRVYVIVPGIHVERVARVFSPHLAHPEQAEDFCMEIVAETPDVGV
jgi:hypothetical protein